MADFHQNGVISTLHNISDRPVEDLEKELREFSKERPIELILPCLFSEIEGPALRKIIQVLSKIEYLNHIIIGLDKASEAQYKQAREFFSHLNQSHSILWNDGPRLSSLDKHLKSQNLSPNQSGKGKNVWYCMGTLARDQAKSVALHDCDILTYSREFIARLYPVSNPLFDYEFCKGYYPRVGDKLNGRVSRL